MDSRQTRLVEHLKRSDAYPHETMSFDVIETHISFVVLTGRYAYKIKKDVRLPFVDFSSLERRRHDCERELELNRRTAAEMYLEVVPIGGSVDAPRVGQTPAIEYAVKMRQFDPNATADCLLESDALTGEMLKALGLRLARFHASLEPIAGGSPIEAVRENLAELEDELLADEAAAKGDLNGRAPIELVDRVRDWVGDRERTLAPAFEARAKRGFVRDCHGDLHLGNLVAVNGDLIPFDCLEFDDDLRTIDVADEVAFLAMDLMARERDDLAFVFLNAYLHETGDYASLALARYYCVHRALVRAKVRQLAHASERSWPARAEWPFLSLAERLTRSTRPLLVITMGLSGSGKSTVTEPLIEALPAIRVRSDVERKRLHGLGADAESGSAVGGGIYGASATAATYERLLEAAEAGLAGGIDIIIDATFLERARRRPFAELARASGAGFVILSCKAPESVLRERIERRQAARDDASEAGLAVLEAQIGKAEPLDETETAHSVEFDTTGTLDAPVLARAIRSAIS